MSKRNIVNWALLDSTSKVDTLTQKRIVAACNVLGAAFAEGWGVDTPHGSVLVLKDPHSPPPKGLDFVVRVVDDDPSTPDALGWHDEENGVVIVEILLDVILEHNPNPLQGDANLASVVAHELFETMIDLHVDEWVMMPDGRFLAKEVCDPVEGMLYPVRLADGTSVHLSNAVLPAYFDPQTPAGTRMDLAGGISAPFMMFSGGYQIIYDPSKFNDPNGPIVSVFDEAMPKWKAEWKKRIDGRADRRIAKKVQEVRRATLTPRDPVAHVEEAEVDDGHLEDQRHLEDRPPVMSDIADAQKHVKHERE